MRELESLTKGRPIAIVGAGLVGAGWALVFARAGLSVRIYDANPSISQASIPLIEKQIADLTGFGLLAESTDAILARLTVCDTLAEAVDGAAYVQESILERTDVKRELMLALEDVAGPDLIIGSSSSGIPASAFASGLNISSRVIIAHPVNPPYLVPVVEVVPSPDTSPSVTQFTAALMEAVGQSVVHVHKEVEGFVLNRLQAVLLREAWSLVEDGVATCEDIDKTIRDGLGWRWSFMGPFETIDLNAVGGVADYAQRLGPLYRSIADSRSHQDDWSPELIKEVEGQRRQYLGHDDLEARRGWRDRALMAFSAQRRKSDTR
ncbi:MULTISPECIES: 3-hydroxyacyl-CoA dehydrogenase [unclassified Pseudomonas]|uniref:3-hydroxyacyl-CoA dehydrogenase n=1 Tax=unclassified Pseudomonas TaxID=196821 RepID=UPI00215C924A|nr:MULTISPECIES: 3-hydroxyacyl-CoA dehydrogenase [unclassified Pseudomonas]MCR8935268.1 3-hydroxyacyl-CoA dehydrogenase [Pseudomonas sp. S11A4]MCR8973531.1 3-hydroxyacyl-CoA dehydrogenase [Pseudomonas sp. S11P7]